MELVLILSVIVCLSALVGYHLVKYMKVSPKKYLSLYKGFLIVFILGITCVLFPIKIEHSLLSWQLFFMIFSCYSIGTAFKELYGIEKERFVYSITFVVTCLGMICKYILEYGEVSNTYNFTSLNMIIYLAIIPTYTFYVYKKNCKIKEN